MSKKCLGCGIQIQNEDSTKVGYSPKIEADYCQRCFKITHYDELTIQVEQGEVDESLYELIEKKDCLIVLVMDLLDFDGNIIEGLQRKIGTKDILVVGTKLDLLPKTLGFEKINQWVVKRMKQQNLNIQGFVVTGNYGKLGIENVLEAIQTVQKNRDVLVMGVANAGKSTLINALSKQQVLTTSLYPGTTLELIEFDYNDIHFIDTPGFMRKDSILHYLQLSDLKKIVSKKGIKPTVFQFWEPMTYSIGGLVRMDVYPNKQGSATFYINNELNIHRTKVDNANSLWDKHYGEMLSPTLVDSHWKDFATYEFKIHQNCKEIAIHGLGFIHFSGDVEKVIVKIDKRVGVSGRINLL